MRILVVMEVDRGVCFRWGESILVWYCSIPNGYAINGLLAEVFFWFWQMCFSVYTSIHFLVSNLIITIPFSYSGWLYKSYLTSCLLRYSSQYFSASCSFSRFASSKMMAASGNSLFNNFGKDGKRDLSYSFLGGHRPQVNLYPVKI